MSGKKMLFDDNNKVKVTVEFDGGTQMIINGHLESFDSEVENNNYVVRTLSNREAIAIQGNRETTYSFSIKTNTATFDGNPSMSFIYGDANAIQNPLAEILNINNETYNTEDDLIDNITGD